MTALVVWSARVSMRAIEGRAALHNRARAWWLSTRLQAADFEPDDMVLAKAGKKTWAMV